MPELPEVQTIINDLQQIIGDRIVGFRSDWGKSLGDSSAVEISRKTKGAKIVAVRRLGKLAVMDLDNGMSLVFHLRMTGQLLLMNDTGNRKSDISLGKHVRHVFYLQKRGFLAFSDVRKFGTLSLLKTATLEGDRKTSMLGIDALSEELTPAKLIKILSAKRSPIKNVLLDQGTVSGIGNIYASEILFDAGISPLREASDLSETEISLLTKSIKKVLKKAIRYRGTSVSDYRDSSGKKGSFQNHLTVYKRGGQKCLRCATILKKIVLGQRSTFYCPNCQK